eukprot:1301898-Pleurochrysis_carterae.AAC.2
MGGRSHFMGVTGLHLEKEASVGEEHAGEQKSRGIGIQRVGAEGRGVRAREAGEGIGAGERKVGQREREGAGKRASKAWEKAAREGEGHRGEEIADANSGAENEEAGCECAEAQRAHAVQHL